MPKFSRDSGPPVVCAVSICATANTLIFAERPMNNSSRNARTAGGIFGCPFSRTSSHQARICAIVAFNSSAITSVRGPGSQSSSSYMPAAFRASASDARRSNAWCICSGRVQ
jgi:hypothetical protein